jgi:hypothetical protein
MQKMRKNTMIDFKKAFKFALILLPIAIIGGIFTGFYLLDTYPEEILAEVITELGSTGVLVVVSTVQTVGYALFCGFFGYILAESIGLWKPVRLQKKPLVMTLIVSVIGGLLFSLDYWTFGAVIDGIQSTNDVGLTAQGVIASILYGGVIEEVMLRLFFMSLIAIILWKVFYKKYDKNHIPTAVFVLANVIAALLFAAGHLPATFAVFGGLTPMLVFRCFLMNGCFAFVFGELYRRYGIVYAMMSHAIFHIVSKLIWFIFV